MKIVYQKNDKRIIKCFVLFPNKFKDRNGVEKWVWLKYIYFTQIKLLQIEGVGRYWFAVYCDFKFVNPEKNEK